MNKIEYYAGNDFIKTFVVRKNNVVYDLTGSTIIFTIKNSDSEPDDTTALYQQRITDHTLSESGISYFSISNSTGSGFSAGNYVYDLQLIDSTSLISTIDKGEFIVYNRVTRSNS